MSNPEKIYKKPQKCLGPSQFATVLGLSKFCSPEELKRKIEEGYVQEVRPEMDFGIQMEKVAYGIYRDKVLKSGYGLTQPQWLHYCTNRRIGGRCDGVIFQKSLDGTKRKSVGLLEIKCRQGGQPLKTIPIYYLVQVAGYLAIYGLPWCDFMSCVLDSNGEMVNYNVIRIEWSEVRDRWVDVWYPKLCTFIENVEWKTE